MNKDRRNAFLNKKYGSDFLDGYVNFLITHVPKQIKYKIRAHILGSPYFFEHKATNVIRNTYGCIFIDIGANVGIYSLTARNNFKQIIAIEPHPKNAKLLNQYTKNYSHILTYQMAVSNFTGTANLYISPVHALHTLNEDQFSQKIIVKVTKLEDLLLNENKIDLIKVDVEGAEWEVLDGAKSIISKIKAWIIELHDMKHKRELDMFFRKFGYTTEWLDYNHIYAKIEP